MRWVLFAVVALACMSCSSAPKPAPSASTSALPEAAPKSAENKAENKDSGVVITIEKFAFHPAQVTVAPGTKIIWQNKDDVGHSVTSDAQAFDSGIFEKNREYARVFNEAGTYPFHCLPHPQMKAQVIVK